MTTEAVTEIDDRGPGSTARSLSIATITSLVFRVVGMAVGIVTTAVLARLLEPAGYGVFSLALTLGTAAAQLADMGVAVTVASRIAREKEGAGRTLSTGLAIRTAVATAVTLGLVGAALVGYLGDSGTIVIIVALATPLSAASVLTAGAMARFRPQVSSALALIQGLLWLLAVLLASGTHADMAMLAWFFVAVTTLQTLIGVFLNRRVIKLRRPTWAEARHIFALCWPLALSGMAFMIYYRLNSVILFDAKGATEFGFYSAAWKMVDVAQLGPGLLIASLLPLVSGSVSGEESRRKMIFSLGMRAGIAIGAGTAVMLIVTAPFVINVLFGAAFGPATKSLTWLAIGFVGISIRWVGTTVCTSAGVVRPVAVVTVPVAALSVLAQLWVCPRWGAVGSAAVMAGTELVIGIASCLLAARAMGSRFPAGQLLATIVACGAVVGCALALPFQWWLEAVLAAAGTAAAFFLTGLITVQDWRRAISTKAV